MTVVEALTVLRRHPVRLIVRGWHWKNALGSALLRGSVFLVANLHVTPSAAVRAMLVECAIRLPLVGALAAIAQHFSGIEPEWAGRAAAAGVLPAMALTVECAIHWSMHTAAFHASMLASAALSIVTSTFSVFAMKRGVLVVGKGERSLLEDVKRLPGLLWEFAFGAREKEMAKG